MAEDNTIEAINAALVDVETVLTTAGVAVGAGRKFRCINPAHDDKNPSCAIYDGSNGEQRWKCFSCGSGGDALDAWGMINNAPTPDLYIPALVDKYNLPSGNGSHRPRELPQQRRPKIVETYQYTDENGAVLFEQCRFEPKDFRPRRPDPDDANKHIYNMEGVRRVLFRLPAICAAVHASRTVYIVEGEKDVMALESIGAVATCSPLGAGKWRDEYTVPLRGARVVILPDKDDPGRAHATKVADSLRGVSATLQTIELPDLNGATVKDAFDYVTAGGSLPDLEVLGESAHEKGFDVFTLSQLRAYTTPPGHKIMGDGFLRRGAGTLAVGGTGLGKSVLAMQISVSVAAGLPFLGCISVPEARRVLHIQAENDEETMQRDLLSIVDYVKADDDLVECNLTLAHCYGRTGTDFVEWLPYMIRKFEPDLIVIDPYQAFVGAVDINGTQGFLEWVSPIQVMLRENEAALLLLAHTPKPRERDGWNQRESVYMAAGTSALSNWCRASMELAPVAQETERFRLTFGKNAERTGLAGEDGNGVCRELYLSHSGNIKTPYWQIAASQDAPSKSKYRDEILTLATTHPSMSQREIARTVGCSIGTVSTNYPHDKR